MHTHTINVANMKITLKLVKSMILPPPREYYIEQHPVRDKF